jgi:hypothetical protein
MTDPIDDIAAALDDFLAALRSTTADNKTRFRALIARDLVRQLRAESAHASVLATIRGGAHRALGCNSSTELAAAIRAGRIDPEQARRRLLAAAERELRILRPSFDTRRDLP